MDPWFDSVDSEYLRKSLINENVDTPAAGFTEALALAGSFDLEWNWMDENNDIVGQKPLLKFEVDLFPIPGRNGNEELVIVIDHNQIDSCYI